jgi:hypothetical protein
MSGFADIDLNVLRGWREELDAELREDHLLPPLARLVRLDGSQIEMIHGPDVLVGRYHPQHGPVDVILRGLADHENYRLGAPHLHLSLDDDAVWRLRGVSPGATTAIDGRLLAHPGERRPIESGSELTMGQIRYRFETSGLTLAEWEDARTRLLNRAQGPSLFLCRRGGPCGPHILLSGAGTTVGRSFPDGPLLAGPSSWDGCSQPDWNLAGLYEDERKFISFEHARVGMADGQWQVSPLGARRKTFVNRLEVIDATSVSFGDEIALGSVIFYLHEPGDDAAPERKALEPPAVIDWQEGSTPILDETSEPSDTGRGRGGE